MDLLSLWERWGEGAKHTRDPRITINYLLTRGLTPGTPPLIHAAASARRGRISLRPETVSNGFPLLFGCVRHRAKATV